ncbi:hypothetical protein [Lentzea cavernae]|uniref:Uncharacterized protein n=1 Tax=Lentzea cavernae TaxID=2020703 RepID=A0ABQ3MQC2_9PSEU|nr:hypothetical protein [Lentzea cavernae]GHH57665.1 hypothetical protein GCM10017774_77570 [Lentzea cavernae]
MELTDDIDTLGVAFHEVGHGLAASKASLAVKRLRIERSWWTGKVSCGYTLLNPPTPDAPATVWQAYSVMLFAGQTAQLRFYDQAGVLTPTVQANVERGSASDFQFWLDDRARTGGMTETNARRSAQAFCDQHWPRMTQLAERLAARMQLAGSAL